jgi:TAG lipase / steryl ester hydrolase / phospholipase A2 / LPA acyltransferase
LFHSYHNVVCAALDFVCDAPVAVGEAPIPTDARLAFFNETRHSYGRTALLLSGGAALGFYHIGVVRTLMRNRLMPRVLGGSSAGSIVCAMIGTRTDEECERDLFQVQGTNAPGHFGRLALNFFRPLALEPLPGTPKNEIAEVYHNTAGAFHDAKRTWQLLFPIGLRKVTSLVYDILTGNRRPQDLLMSDTAHFAECVRVNVGDFTFQEAFDRTGRILNITGTCRGAKARATRLAGLPRIFYFGWSNTFFFIFV